MRRFFKILLTLAALSAAVGPSPLLAQEADDEEPTSEEALEERNAERSEEDGIRRFEDVTVKRIRPEELPPAESTKIPKVLRGGRLPSPPSLEQLKATAQRVRPRVFEMVAIQRPRAPGKATPIVHRGHAVFVKGPVEEGPPVLVTTFFWLSDAEKLYLVPRSRSTGDGHGSEDEGLKTERAAGKNANLPRARRRDLDEVTVDGRTKRWLEENRDELVAARLFHPDEHRNLVVVVPESLEKLGLPSDGLELLDLTRESPTRLYGLSPHAGDGLTQTSILGGQKSHKALMYYLQTGFRPVFGAPIVSTDGKLLVLTAFRHPKKKKKKNITTLVIPPEPLRNYLKEVQRKAK